MNGRNARGNVDNISTSGGERGTDLDEAQRTYIHRPDDYTINSLHSFSFGNASTSKPQANLIAESDTIRELANVEEPEEDISPTITTMDVTPRPSVVHTHPDALPYSSKRLRIPGSSSSPSSSEPDSDSQFASSSAHSQSATRTSRTSHSTQGREEVEFSSDDDSYEFDNLDYPEGDDGGDNIEISSARFSATSGSSGQGFIGDYASYGPSEGYRDREGSVATLRMKTIERDHSPPVFTSPFASAATASTSSSVHPSAGIPPHTNVSPTSPSTDTASSGMDTDFDFAYITSFGTDLSADPSSSIPDFVRPRRQSAISLSGNRESSGRKDSLGKSLFFSWFSGRRPSTATVASSNSSNMFIHDDSFARNLLKWGGEGYKEQRKDWTIRREVRSGVSSSSTSPTYKDEKLKRVTTTTTAPRTSTATNITTATSTDVGSLSSPEQVSSSHRESEGSHTKTQSHDGNKEKDPKSDHSHKEREKERLRRSTMHWRGMPIGSEELWSNDLMGRFLVTREEVGRGTKVQDPTKGPQQRLLIRFRSESQPTPKDAELHLHLPHPPVTVHKHSKAMAFSLTRYYKPSSVRNPSAAIRARSATPSESPTPSHGHLPPHLRTAGVVGSGSTSASVPRASNRIILLAPRRVQEAFTSTNTTKMLADHGLLSSNSPVSRKEKDGGRDKDRDWRKKSISNDGPSTYRTSPSPEQIRRRKSLSASQSQSQSSSSSSSSPPPPIPPLPLTPSTPSPLSPSTAAPTPPNSSSVAVPLIFSDSVPIDASIDSIEIPSSSSSATSSTTHASLASSSTSVSQRMSSCTTTTDNTEHTDRSSTLVDSEQSETSYASASEASASQSSASSSRPPHRLRVPRRRMYDHDRDYDEDETDQSSYNDDEDDDLYGYRSHRDGGPSRVIRTPHSETYGTVDFGSANDRQRILQLVSESSPSSSSSSFSLLRFINRNVRSGVIDSLDPSASALRATAGPAFDPPWLTFPSRGKQEQQRRVVDNLNMSFKDVGLLPSTPRESSGRYGSSNISRSSRGTVTGSGRRKSLGGGVKSRKDKGKASDPSQDVFASIPSESLCMLLPLWPGDTDPYSQAHSQHVYPPSQASFKKPVLPLEKRMFLLVWYKALEPQIPPSKVGKDGHRKHGQDKEEVALAVIDSLIGLPPDTDKEKGRDKRDKKIRSTPAGSANDSGKDSGKSSHTSPTSSGDSTGFLRSSRSLGGLGIGSSPGRGTGSTASGSHSLPNQTWAQLHANDERNILLPGFLITARRVSYCDLQGTGVRVPDEGVTVNGPLEEAWRECLTHPDSMPGFTTDPGSPLNTSFMPDPTIIAVCHSRESGVEFDPEALISLGLCKVLNPLPMGMVAEDFVEHRMSSEGSQEGWGFGGVELKLKLTPVGRAIMELCWVGGLALTSFGPS
ncbi:hypothetical protein C8R42DRAFT_303907 [Lentinula raphanica]|nr:hypothetical protein C8R42DRAFT_303907 [Lentinula raphanica]